MSSPTTTTLLFDSQIASIAHQQWLLAEGHHMLATKTPGAENLCTWQGSVYAAFDPGPEDDEDPDEREILDYGLCPAGEEYFPSLIVQSGWKGEYGQMFKEMKQWMTKGLGEVQIAILLEWNIARAESEEHMQGDGVSLECRIEVYEYTAASKELYRLVLRETTSSLKQKDLPDVLITYRQLFGGGDIPAELQSGRGTRNDRSAHHSLCLNDLWYIALDIFEPEVEDWIKTMKGDKGHSGFAEIEDGGGGHMGDAPDEVGEVQMALPGSGLAEVEECDEDGDVKKMQVEHEEFTTSCVQQIIDIPVQMAVAISQDHEVNSIHEDMGEVEKEVSCVQQIIDIPVQMAVAIPQDHEVNSVHEDVGEVEKEVSCVQQIIDIPVQMAVAIPQDHEVNSIHEDVGEVEKEVSCVQQIIDIPVQMAVAISQDHEVNSIHEDMGEVEKEVSGGDVVEVEGHGSANYVAVDVDEEVKVVQLEDQESSTSICVKQAIDIPTDLSVAIPQDGDDIQTIAIYGGSSLERTHDITEDLNSNNIGLDISHNSTRSVSPAPLGAIVNYVQMSPPLSPKDVSGASTAHSAVEYEISLDHECPDSTATYTHGRKIRTTSYQYSETTARICTETVSVYGSAETTTTDRRLVSRSEHSSSVDIDGIKSSESYSQVVTEGGSLGTGGRLQATTSCVLGEVEEEEEEDQKRLQLSLGTDTDAVVHGLATKTLDSSGGVITPYNGVLEHESSGQDCGISMIKAITHEGSEVSSKNSSDVLVPPPNSPKCASCGSTTCCHGPNSPFLSLPPTFISAGVLGPFTWCGFTVYVALSRDSGQLSEIEETKTKELFRIRREELMTRLTRFTEVTEEYWEGSTTVHRGKTVTGTSGGHVGHSRGTQGEWNQESDEIRWRSEKTIQGAERDKMVTGGVQVDQRDTNSTRTPTSPHASKDIPPDSLDSNLGQVSTEGKIDGSDGQSPVPVSIGPDDILGPISSSADVLDCDSHPTDTSQARIPPRGVGPGFDVGGDDPARTIILEPLPPGLKTGALTVLPPQVAGGQVEDGGVEGGTPSMHTGALFTWTGKSYDEGSAETGAHTESTSASTVISITHNSQVAAINTETQSATTTSSIAITTTLGEPESSLGSTSGNVGKEQICHSPAHDGTSISHGVIVNTTPEAAGGFTEALATADSSEDFEIVDREAGHIHDHGDTTQYSGHVNTTLETSESISGTSSGDEFEHLELSPTPPVEAPHRDTFTSEVPTDHDRHEQKGLEVTVISTEASVGALIEREAEVGESSASTVRNEPLTHDCDELPGPDTHAVEADGASSPKTAIKDITSEENVTASTVLCTSEQQKSSYSTEVSTNVHTGPNTFIDIEHLGTSATTVASEEDATASTVLCTSEQHKSSYSTEVSTNVHTGPDTFIDIEHLGTSATTVASEEDVTASTVLGISEQHKSSYSTEVSTNVHTGSDTKFIDIEHLGTSATTVDQTQLVPGVEENESPTKQAITPQPGTCAEERAPSVTAGVDLSRVGEYSELVVVAATEGTGIVTGSEPPSSSGEQIDTEYPTVTNLNPGADTNSASDLDGTPAIPITSISTAPAESPEPVTSAGVQHTTSCETTADLALGEAGMSTSQLVGETKESSFTVTDSSGSLPEVQPTRPSPRRRSLRNLTTKIIRTMSITSLKGEVSPRVTNPRGTSRRSSTGSISGSIPSSSHDDGLSSPHKPSEPVHVDTGAIETGISNLDDNTLGSSEGTKVEPEPASTETRTPRGLIVDSGCTIPSEERLELGPIAFPGGWSAPQDLSKDTPTADQPTAESTPQAPPPLSPLDTHTQPEEPHHHRHHDHDSQSDSHSHPGSATTQQQSAQPVAFPGEHTTGTTDESSQYESEGSNVFDEHYLISTGAISSGSGSQEITPETNYKGKYIPGPSRPSPPAQSDSECDSISSTGTITAKTIRHARKRTTATTTKIQGYDSSSPSSSSGSDSSSSGGEGDISDSDNTSITRRFDYHPQPRRPRTRPRKQNSAAGATVPFIRRLSDTTVSSVMDGTGSTSTSTSTYGPVRRLSRAATSVDSPHVDAGVFVDLKIDVGGSGSGPHGESKADAPGTSTSRCSTPVSRLGPSASLATEVEVVADATMYTTYISGESEVSERTSVGEVSGELGGKEKEAERSRKTSTRVEWISTGTGQPGVDRDCNGETGGRDIEVTHTCVDGLGDQGEVTELGRNLERITTSSGSTVSQSHGTCTAHEWISTVDSRETFGQELESELSLTIDEAGANTGLASTKNIDNLTSIDQLVEPEPESEIKQTGRDPSPSSPGNLELELTRNLETHTCTSSSTLDLSLENSTSSTHSNTGTTTTSDLLDQLQSILAQLNARTGQVITPKLNVNMHCEAITSEEVNVDVDVGMEVEVEVEVKVRYRQSAKSNMTRTARVDHAGMCRELREMWGAGGTCELQVEVD